MNEKTGYLYKINVRPPGGGLWAHDINDFEQTLKNGTIVLLVKKEISNNPSNTILSSENYLNFYFLIGKEIFILKDIYTTNFEEWFEEV